MRKGLIGGSRDFSLVNELLAKRFERTSWR
jgi:hypothetical protein